MLKTRLTANDYRKNCGYYGVFSVLLTLEKLEQSESFEECSKVLKGLQQFNELTGLHFPTRYSKQALRDCCVDETQEELLTVKSKQNCEELYSLILENVL